MKESLNALLQDPVSGEELEIFPFVTGVDSLGDVTVIEGLLHAPAAGRAYPIINGVPVMLPSAFPQTFLDSHCVALSKLGQPAQLQLTGAPGDTFSFSAQWALYFDQRVGRTWGSTVPERIEQLLMEMQVDRDWFRGKTVLDAGCGPAGLSEGIAALGADVVGLDYSSAVYEAERRRVSRTLQFVRGDLCAAGLKSNSFDAALCIGVITNTRDSEGSFSEICRLVKPAGRFYVWVYRRPETFLRRYIKYPVFDLARLIIARLPGTFQAMTVRAWATLVHGLHTLVHGEERVPYKEYLVSAYDDLTPQWRRYHTPYELAEWFHQNGFASPTLSHWDNPYGFGLVAIKNKQEATPGMHYGSAPKLWEEGQTLIG
jgi:ubiquinone/menaquinone biosynthesis C-methylase UbiE/uncharacterized protein YbaR (Trm112 family)